MSFDVGLNAAVNEVRTGIAALRVNRDFPTMAAITPASPSTTSYAYIASLEIDMNGAPSGAFSLSIPDAGTNDKIAVMIYGSVDGSNFSSAWHEKITGSIDPIINDYGAVEKVYEVSSSIRKIRIYAKQTVVGVGRSAITLVPQIKYEAVSPNQSELIKKFIDACADLNRGAVGALIQNWPGNNLVPYNFVDTTNLGTVGATVILQYPSATGMPLAGISDLSLTGNIIIGANNTVKLYLEVTDDEDLTAGWKKIWFLDEVTGMPANEIIGVTTPGVDFAISGRGLGCYANIRLSLEITIAVAPAVAANTVVIKGNGVGGA